MQYSTASGLLSSLGRDDGRIVLLGRQFNPCLRPVMNGLNYRLEITPLFGQAILHAHRDLRVNDALDNTLDLQFAQAIAQHAVRESLHSCGHLAEALWTLQQRVENQACPAFAEQLNCMLVARAHIMIGGVYFCWLHCLPTSFRWYKAPAGASVSVCVTTV